MIKLVMKKLFLFILIGFLFSNANAIEQLKDVGISKYMVLEVNQNNIPLREKPDETSRRIAHLFKKSVLYADRQSQYYYRVELKNGEYGWINKRYADVQAVIPEKRIDNIKKISFREDKAKYYAEFEIPTLSAFTFKEEENGLKFTLYDNRFDPTEVKTENLNSNFNISDKIENYFELNYFSGKPLFGYNIERTPRGYLVAIRKAPKINPRKPLKNIKITIDPGHGGQETGAVAFDLEEKNLNLEISKKLKNELRKKGAKVYLTRTKDTRVGLYDRIDFANSKDSDILLSIHQNSLARREDLVKKHGVGTYYYNQEAKSLAENIKSSLVKATNFRDDKTNYASFAITRATMPVAVLIECGYIIKEDEAEKLSDKLFQKVIAIGITRGVENYLLENFTHQEK